MTVAIVSFRLNGPDGVSIEAAKWAGAFGQLGWRVVTVAGEETADRVVAGLGIGDSLPPDDGEVEAALDDADLVVVENLCSLPLNRPAADVVTKVLAGRAAILHHHDLPWQRSRHRHIPHFPPTDDAWAHVTINELSRLELVARGIPATTIYNCFDTDAVPGDRASTRQAMDIHDDEVLLLHPTRAIPRKNIPGALRLAEAIGATYWLLGPAEDGFDAELDRLLAATPARVVRGIPPKGNVADAYAAADAVTLPSTWEGFGNATVESAIHRRPLAIGEYPVAAEIAAHGFRWFPADDGTPLGEWLEAPDPTIIDGNLAVARKHFSLERLQANLAALLPVWGFG
ncbi:MAG TPA: glycosyltransferase [Acidimicrobiales bacterium]